MRGSVSSQLSPRSVPRRTGLGGSLADVPNKQGGWQYVLDSKIVQGQRYAIQILTPPAWGSSDAQDFMGPDFTIDFVTQGGVGGAFGSFIVSGVAKADRDLKSTEYVTYSWIARDVPFKGAPPPVPKQLPDVRCTDGTVVPYDKPCPPGTIPVSVPAAQPPASDAAIWGWGLFGAASLAGVGYGIWRLVRR